MNLAGKTDGSCPLLFATRRRQSVAAERILQLFALLRIAHEVGHAAHEQKKERTVHGAMATADVTDRQVDGSLVRADELKHAFAFGRNMMSSLAPCFRRGLCAVVQDQTSRLEGMDQPRFLFPFYDRCRTMGGTSFVFDAPPPAA